jgi:hypothetical protein
MKVTDEYIKKTAEQYFEAVAASADAFKEVLAETYAYVTKTASVLFDYYENEVNKEVKNDK